MKHSWEAKKRVQWYILGRLEHGGCDSFPFTIHEDKETSTKELGQIKSFPTKHSLGREKKEFNGTTYMADCKNRGCDLNPFHHVRRQMKQNTIELFRQNSYTKKIWAKLIHAKMILMWEP
jgi:hypothetical protein